MLATIGRWVGALLVAAVLGGCSANAESRCLASLELSFEAIDASSVLADCQTVAGADAPQVQFATARALQKADRLDEAMALYRSAAGAGFGRAFNNLGLLATDPAEAVRLYEQGHALGDPASTTSLGLALITGQGVPVDLERGMALYREAADKGNLQAKYNLAWMLEFGTGVQKDPAGARRLLSEAAEGGLRHAQYFYGMAVLGGDGVRQDSKAGLAWLEKAAAQGEPNAQGQLALLLEQGKLVTRDDARALELLVAAAGQGFGPAELHLARRYMEGRGVTLDEARGRQLLLSAAGHGEPTAQYLSGMMYLEGMGDAADPAKAEAYLGAAAQAGIVPALTHYAFLRPESERVALLTQAAERGDADAIFHLGTAYLWGEWGVEKDVERGWQIVEMAAERNHGRALLMLAYDRENGHEKRRNLRLARALYEKALQHPDPEIRKTAEAELYEMDGGFEGEQRRRNVEVFIGGAITVFTFLGSISGGDGTISSEPTSTPQDTLCSTANAVYAWSGNDSYRQGYGCW